MATAKASFPNLEGQLQLTRAWFLDFTWIENERGTGWAHYAEPDPGMEGAHGPTAWGGTVEGIRTLLRLGVTPQHEKMRKALEWLEAQQSDDGSWPSWGIRVGCVESTAWVLIALQQAGVDLSKPRLQSATAYLKKLARKQDHGAAWAAYGGAPTRVYPTLLAIWALHTVEPALARDGAKWLKQARNADGGWGFQARDKTSNPAMTGMVLYVLETAGLLTEEKIRKEAIACLWARRQPGGTWINVQEDWRFGIDPQTGSSLPTDTKHLSTAWAIMALLRAGVSPSDTRIIESVSGLAARQEPDGSWLYDEHDAKKHSWCVANAAIALADARDAFVKAVMSGAGVLEPAQAGPTDAATRRSRLHFIVLYTILAIVILYILGVFGFAWDFLTPRLGGYAEEILLGLVGAGLVAAIGAGARYARKGRAR